MHDYDFLFQVAAILAFESSRFDFGEVDFFHGRF